MDFWIIVIGLAIVAVLAYLLVPKFKAKADKTIDKDGDGKPFR